MNETDPKVVLNPPFESQEGAKSSASVQNEGRKCPCSPLRRNRVYFSRNLARACFLLSSPLFYYFFFFFASVGGSAARPTRLRRGPAIWSSSWPLGACGCFLGGGVRPAPTPDGRLGASRSAVGRGMCVVDGSLRYIGCWRFCGWGGPAPRCRPCPAAARRGGLVGPRSRGSKCCLGPRPPLCAPSLPQSMCHRSPRNTSRNVSRAVLQLFIGAQNLSKQATPV